MSLIIYSTTPLLLSSSYPLPVPPNVATTLAMLFSLIALRIAQQNKLWFLHFCSFSKVSYTSCCCFCCTRSWHTWYRCCLPCCSIVLRFGFSDADSWNILFPFWQTARSARWRTPLPPFCIYVNARRYDVVFYFPYSKSQQVRNNVTIVTNETKSTWFGSLACPYYLLECARAISCFLLKGINFHSLLWTVGPCFFDTFQTSIPIILQKNGLLKSI